MQNLREKDLVDVCDWLGLERDPNDHKQFKSDGVRLCVNGTKWFDHNAQKGGGGAIDLVIHVKNCTFKQAVAFLGDTHATTTTQTPIKPRTPTKPPEPDNSGIFAITAYLTNERGLNHDFVQWCINRGLIYADSRRNCVFKYGETGAELRGIGEKQWRAVYGTIERGFILPAANAVGVAVVESAIDALSYRQLHRTVITVSLAGNSNHKVIEQAVMIAHSKRLPVISAFDNDKGGNIAHELLSDCAISNGVALISDRPETKDWNTELNSLKKAAYEDSI